MTKAEEKELKRQEKLAKEIARIEELKKYEKEYSEYSYICGIDEVGRGPLAGPVVAAAVILPKDCDILYINDSKKLSEKRREELFDQIKEAAICWAIGRLEPDRIDEINILEATKEAMADAINSLSIKPQHVLIDALTLKTVDIPQTGIIKGDATSVSIAAASILAKVTRDRIMREWDKVYPEYGFSSHKGYGTKAHIEAIKKYGMLDIHRRSFIHF